MSVRKVILSAPLVLEEGTFDVKFLSLAQALTWVRKAPVDNYCGHETVRILDLSPDKGRRECAGYDEALCIKPRTRLEFGREYTKEEIAEIGMTFTLISKRQQ